MHIVVRKPETRIFFGESGLSLFGMFKQALFELVDF